MLRSRAVRTTEVVLAYIIMGATRGIDKEASMSSVQLSLDEQQYVEIVRRSVSLPGDSDVLSSLAATETARGAEWCACALIRAMLLAEQIDPAIAARVDELHIPPQRFSQLIVSVTGQDDDSVEDMLAEDAESSYSDVVAPVTTPIEGESQLCTNTQ
jgi:hypothetical protein